MKKIASLALATTLIALGFGISNAHAGNPCPIEISIVDLGIPDWAKPSLVKKVKNGDSFLKKLAAAGANDEECTKAMIYKTNIETEGGEIKRETLKAKLVDKKKRFQCKVAGRMLKKLKATGDTLLYYRGHSRILLATPGKSMCVQSKKADAMSDKQVRKLFVKMTDAYVSDRHANP